MKNFFSKLVRVAMLTLMLSAIGLNTRGTVFYQGRVFGAAGAPVSGANVRVQVQFDIYFNFGFGWNYIGSQNQEALVPTDGNGVWTFVVGDNSNYQYVNPRATIVSQTGGWLNDPTVYQFDGNAQNVDFTIVPLISAGAPGVTLNATTGVGTTEAKLNGVVNPNAAFAPRWAFQYGVDQNFNVVTQSPAAAVAPGGAANLDGVDDYLDVADGVYFNGGDYTMEGWVYARSHANWSRMFDFGNGGGFDNVLLALSAGATGYPTMHVYNSVGGIILNIQSRFQLPLNQWVHLAAVRSGNTGIIYMNGAEVTRGNFTGAPSNVTRTQNYIGRSNWPQDSYANAYFDDLRIWTSARTAAEINNGRFQDLGFAPLVSYRFDQFGSALEEDKANLFGTAQNATFYSGVNPNAGGRTDNSLNAPGLPPAPYPSSSIVSGLVPDTLYWVREYASSAAGTTYSGIGQFTTTIGAPTMTVANLTVDEDAGAFSIPITGIGDGDPTLDATFRIEVVVNDPNPNKFTLLAPAPGSRTRYQYIGGSFTWQEAKRDAIRRGGHLVTIASVLEQITAFAVVPNVDSRQAWIGLSDSVIEGQFRWDNNELVPYTNWNGGEPNDFGGNEDYVHFGSTGRWNDLPGNARLGYVLEYEDITPAGALYTTTGTLPANTTSYNIQFNTIFNQSASTPLTVRLFVDYGNGKVQMKEQQITLTINAVDDGPTVGFGSTLDISPAGNGHLTLPADSYFSGPFTVESWVYVRSHRNWARLFDFGNGAGVQNVLLSLSQGTTGKPVFSIYNADGLAQLVSADALPLNQWVHVAAVFDGTTGFIYVNGDEKARGAMTAPDNVSRANNYIGRSNWGGDAYGDFKMSEFRIWNLARTPEDLKLFSTFPLEGNQTALQVYLRAIEGAGPVVKDFADGTGQGGVRSGTIVGSVGWILAGLPEALPLGSTDVRVPVGEDQERRMGLPGYDFESSPLPASAWSIFTPPTLGTLTPIAGTPGAYRFMPNVDVNGLDQFTYRVTANGVSSNYTVFLEISPDNDPPVLSPIANQNFLENTTNNVQFTVTDNETPIGNLIFTLTSSDQGVVANGGLTVAGSGTNKVLVIRPNAGESGVTTITLRVTDAGAGAFPAKSTEVVFDVAFEPLPAFAILDIGTLGSYTESEGVAINDKWEALANASGNQQLSRTFLYGGPATVAPLKGFEPVSGVSTRGGALNNKSAISFESILANGNGSLVFHDGAAATVFLPPPSTATLLRGGLNDESVTAGSALISGSWRAVRADTPSSVAANLGVPGGFNATWGFDINIANTIVGVASNINGNVRGYVYTNGPGFTLIPLLAGGTNNSARGINKGGQVAGSSQTRLVDGSVLDVGGGRYVKAPDQAWFTGTLFAIEAWVYVREHASHQRLLDFGNGQDDDNVVVALSNGTDGKPYFDVLRGASRLRVQSPTALALNTWSHVAVVYSGSVGIIYINGVEVANAPMHAPMNVVRTKNYIGKSNWTTDGAGNFLLDNLRIWSVARTPANVLADKELISAAGTSGLLAQYLFDEGSGNSAQDSSGNNRNGSLVGGSIFSGPNGLAYGPMANRAILFSINETFNLGTLPNGGDSVGFAVNELGKVAGQAIAEGKVNATLHAAGALHNLNLLVSEEDDNLWHLNDARAINRHGAVVGTGIKGGVKRAYMALPATVVGRKVVRPQGAVTNFAPDIEIVDGKGYGTLASEFFYWSPGESKLFATRPCIAKLKWHLSSVLSTNTDRIDVLTANIWPRVPTIHVVGAPVDLEPKTTNALFGFAYQQLHYPDEQTQAVVIDASTKSFDAKIAGWSVVRYLRTGGQTPDPLHQAAYFEVVRSFVYNDQKVFKDNVNWLVGDTIENAGHFDYGKNGWVFFEKSFYDGDGPDRAYDRPTRKGPIIPVNTDTQVSDDLVVGWYKTNQIGVAWPSEAWRYSLAWPEDTANKIIIASQLGTGRIDESLIREARVYVQPDPTRPGFNPNEEHALMAPSDSGMAMFALRNDLNELENFSRPFSLLKYRDVSGEWRVKVYKVLSEEAPYFFRYPGVAGREIQSPYPLSVLQICDPSYYETGPGWEDYHGKIYARAAGQYGGQTNIIIRYFYPLQPTFYSPKKPGSSANYLLGECMPWLDRLPGNRPGTPNVTTFVISWPDDVPFLNIGQSALKPINGLPDFLHMADAKIIYDDHSLNSGNDLANLARLYDPISPRTYRLLSTEKVPDSILRISVNGKDQFKDLPWSLRTRLKFDPINKWLSFEGYFQPDFDVGDPLLLPNVLTDLERRRLLELAPNDAKWTGIIQKLYDLTRNPNQLDSNWDNSIDLALLIGLELTTNTIQISQAQAAQVIAGTSPLVKPAQVVSMTQGANLLTDLKYRFIRPQQFGDITKALTAGYNVPTALARPLQAAEFSGSGVGMQTAAGIELNNRSFTVEFWAKRNEILSEDYIVSQGADATGQGLQIGFQSNSLFRFSFTGDDLDLTTPITETGTWHHYACTFDSDLNTQVIYVDGREMVRRTSNGDYSGLGPVWIGSRWGDVATAFNGQIDELRIWRRALNGFEIAQGRRKSLVGNENTLVLYLKFDQLASGAVANLASKNLAGLPAVASLNGGVSLDVSDAPAAIPPRYVTVAENDNPILGALPISLKVVRIDDGPYAGDLKALLPDNVFDERLTMRQSPDFGGDPGSLKFEWYYHPAVDGTPPQLPDLDVNGNIVNTRGWIRFLTDPSDGGGMNQITIGEGGESSIITLSDNWFISRYKGYTINTEQNWSDWVGDPAAKNPRRPALAEGWIKRVIRGLNPFDQRIANFRVAEVSTLVSMLGQAGARYEGDIAFNPGADAINGVGLIEAYETVIRRGKNLSMDGIPAINFAPANNAVLLATTKVADLYTLLGNEAYADAQDPTIGFGSLGDPGGQSYYGSLAASIFAFQNQLDSLLEEELVLLRGRDDRAAGTQGAPIYNRLFWNFTLGEGEVAYQQNYNITDQNKSGFIEERDARIMYPQGHGDAWGHYLKALKMHYELLRHQNFTWIPTTEPVAVAGAAIEVDFLDERKFATTAALKAKAGAEIVDLTYRQGYVDDPAGQWQGYKDTDPDRAWGVTDWARRAAMGSYFDWLTANTILPSTDPNTNHVGIQKVDRTTVRELDEIVAQHDDVQNRLDMADQGLNPLGLARGVVPFDIDPGQVTAGRTHFEQVQERATKAMNNAIATWNEANQANELLRRNQDTLEKFKANVQDQERDYKNRLIELFGYPYAGDIGPGKTFPSGYDGPDIYHYQYIATTELNNDTAPASQSFKAYFKQADYGVSHTGNTQSGAFGNKVQNFYFPEDVQGDISDRLGQETMVVDMPYTTADWGFRAPAEWGQRRAPGEIQVALGEMLQAETRVKEANLRYDNLIDAIEDQVLVMEERYALRATELKNQNDVRNIKISMGVTIAALKGISKFLNNTISDLKLVNQVMYEGSPRVVGFAVDAFAPFRGAITGILNAGTKALSIGAVVAESGVEVAQTGITVAEGVATWNIQKAQFDYEVQQQVRELEDLMRQEAILRVDCFRTVQSFDQSFGRFKQALAKGQRTIEERLAFRNRTAGDISNRRYQDMTFRIFRNDALQKYRAQFDLAQRYVFLAATAYDYEVNLLGTDSRAGQSFLTDIIRQRGLGQMREGVPIAGPPGLADPLARLSENFGVLKTQLGFNNPQTETGRFSMRNEHFRLKDSTPADWRSELKKARVDNLWEIPEFRRYCRPFAPETAGPQPGLVIRFDTAIRFGENFFGWPLSGGDSAYDPSRFATKVHSVGVWFTGYNGNGMSITPRIYLVPVGVDMLRSPTGNDLSTRQWRVLDQALPVPFTLGSSALSSPGYIPMVGSLGGSFAEIRRFASFRGYHDSGFFSESEAISDSRLIGRSVWNSEWMLIIPGGTLLANPNQGLDSFIASVSDIKLFFQTYSYAGN